MKVRANIVPAVVGATIGVLLATLAMVLFTGHHGSTAWVTQTRAVTRFDQVQVDLSARVTITRGGASAVSVRAPKDTIGQITARVRGGRLVLSGPASTKSGQTPQLAVTAPGLRSVRLAGAGLVDAERVDAGAFTAVLSGSGLVRVSGTATTLRTSLSGSGDLELGALEARDVRAALGGSGRIAVNATRSLTATLSGVGAIQYHGDPAIVRKDVTGTGTIGPG